MIFRTAYDLSGCAKPMRRLWISSMEDEAIKEGFAALKDGSDYDGLHQSALCRAKADWLVGINATRLFSLLYNHTLNVGRVLSPTLALIVEREAEISAFRPVPFYTVSLDCGFTATGERIAEKPEAEAVAAACKGQKATLQAVEQKERTEKPPALYDLTTLQRDANRTLGYTAQQTLDYLQSLYEKKLCTYPRTDSRFLTGDMEAGVPALASVAALVCGANPPDACNAAQVCDSSKVSDHHAIVPTSMAGNADLAALPAGEREVLRLVSYGLLKSVSPAHRFAETSVTVECGKTDSPPRAERSWRLAGKPTHRNRPTNRRAAGCRTAYRRGRTFPWRTCLSRKARPRPRNTLPRIPCWRRWRQPGPKICRRTRNAGAWERPPPAPLSWKSWCPPALWNERKRKRP